LWRRRFGKLESAAETPVAADVVRSNKLERLLIWLSAKGCGTWNNFAEACETLELSTNALPAKGILRRLRLLGHLELSANGDTWMVAPATCVTCVTGDSRHFLAGSRTVLMGPKCDLEWVQHQPDYTGPLRIDCRAREASTFRSVGKASLWLGNVLPDICQWRDGLPTIDGLDAVLYDVERWDGNDFQSCTFVQNTGEWQSPSGLYRLAKKDRPQFSAVEYFFDRPTGRWLRGEFYGLRFLAIRENGSAMRPINYDPQQSRLFVNVRQRWPLMYEKALVLASGFLPQRPANSDWLIYEGVSRHLCDLLASKLQVVVKEVPNA
jgi:hypothetical protein